MFILLINYSVCVLLTAQRYGGFGGFANISQTSSRSCDDTGSDMRQTADKASKPVANEAEKISQLIKSSFSLPNRIFVLPLQHITNERVIKERNVIKL